METQELEKGRPGPKKKYHHEMKRINLHVPEPMFDAINDLAANQYPPSSTTALIQLAIMQLLQRRGAKLPEKL